jgi:hypothetical protein
MLHNEELRGLFRSPSIGRIYSGQIMVTGNLGWEDKKNAYIILVQKFLEIIHLEDGEDENVTRQWNIRK